MALKDWDWLGEKHDGEEAWYNEEKDVRIEIVRHDRDWAVTKDLKKLSKKFKRKSQAISYAKKYMRSH